MKRIFLSAIIVCLVTAAFAQKPASVMFVEIGGPGLFSINYDTRFDKKEGGLGCRIGLGGYADSYESIFTIPLGINYLLGKDDKNYFEIGAGFTYASTTTKDNYFSGEGQFSTSFGHLNFGYRMAPKKGGFMFRAAINPIISSEGFFPFYGGIGFGYKF